MTARRDADVATTAERYHKVRATTEALASPLTAEDQTVQSMPDVSPTKWHRAHTTWFFETFVLSQHLSDYVPFDPAYAFLFNSYYEAIGPRHARDARGVLSRPGIAEIAAYRHHVDQHMHRLLIGAVAAELSALVSLGLHHEQQHQELLLMDAKHVLSRNPVDPVYVGVQPRGRAAREAATATWMEVDGGMAEIGHTGPGFAFDNESPRHQVLLRPYELAASPVSCGDWSAFIDDGGYARPELWLSDGWATVQQQGWEAPLYWRRDDGSWSVFTLHGCRPVDAEEPVCHVSYYEADAFARWAGARLPLEAEWEHAVADSSWAVDVGGRFDMGDLQPRPSALPGEVWEWTASPYVAYPGFRAAPGAVGEYNGKFMVNQQVLRGSSCLTPDGHQRLTYRNFFPPGARWACSGLRLARDL
jgi:ergothioneine biosynthesis protein EgtB